MISSLEAYRTAFRMTTPLSLRTEFFELVMLGFLWFAKNDPFSKEAAQKLLERLGERDDVRLENAYRIVCNKEVLATPVEAAGEAAESPESGNTPEVTETSDPSDAEEFAEASATTEAPETTEAADSSRSSETSDTSSTSGPVTLSEIGRRLDPRKIREKRKARTQYLTSIKEAALSMKRTPAERTAVEKKALETVRAAQARALEATKAEAATPEGKSCESSELSDLSDLPEPLESLEPPELPETPEVAEASEAIPELQAPEAPETAPVASSSPADRFAELFALDPSAATRTVFDLPFAPESGHGGSSSSAAAGGSAASPGTALDAPFCERLPKPAYGRARVLAYMRRAGTFMNLFFTHRFDALGNYVTHDFTSEFPRLGAANLRTHRKARLQEGAFYVCDLESDDSFVNRDAGSGAPRKDFERAIDYDRLAAEGRLHPLEDDGGYLVVRPRVEDINLEKDILVRFRPEGTEMSDSDGEDVADEGLTHLHVRNVPVLLAVGNRYYGPVKLKEDGQQRPYVNLATRDANARRGLVVGFLKEDPAIRTLRAVEECITASCPVEIAFAAGATPKLFDVLSDATLAEKVLPSVLAAGPEFWANEFWANAASSFGDGLSESDGRDESAGHEGRPAHERPIAALPPEAENYVTTDPAIAKTRLMRIARLLAVRRMGAEAADVVGQAIAELLESSLDAKSPGGRIVGRIAGRIAATPELAKKIEGYGELARRIDDLKTEIGRLETSLKATESVAEREAERVRREAEERNRTLLDETERLEAKLAEKTRVLGNIEASADLVAMRNDLEASLAKLADEEKRLRTEAKAAEAYLENALERARNFAFDGVFAEKLLEAAGSRKKAEEELRIETRVRETAARTRFTADPVTLARTLVADVQRRRDYDRLTILNLFILLTQNFLTVLSGPPGAGKTSISVILGDVLGLTEKSDRSDGSDLLGRFDRTGGTDPADRTEEAECTESTERFLPVSVERGWTSKRDFLGYWNPLSKTFESPDPRRSDALALLDAEARAGFDDLPFVMLLDEANLSPMEYYWGDFMRICDDRSRMNRIALGGDALYDVPDTLRFLATINSDFTTENLSPRLLDRAPVVTLPETEPDFANLGDRGASYEDGEVGETDEGTHDSDSAPRPPVSWRAMRAAFGPRAHFEGEAEALALLEEVVAAFRATGGVTSVRTRRAMRDYVSSAVPVFCEADADGNGATTGVAPSKLSKLSKFPTATQKTAQKARGKSTLKGAAVKAVNAVTAASASQSVSQGATARLSVTDGVSAAVDFAVAARLLPRIEGSGDAYREKLETFGETLAGLGLTRSRSILDGILARGESALGWYRFF